MERLRLDRQGRLLVPAGMRKAMGLRVGSELLATVQCGRLILETSDAAWARFRALFGDVPPDSSVVEELLAERRDEVGRDWPGCDA